MVPTLVLFDFLKCGESKCRVHTSLNKLRESGKCSFCKWKIHILSLMCTWINDGNRGNPLITWFSWEKAPFASDQLLLPFALVSRKCFCMCSMGGLSTVGNYRVSIIGCNTKIAHGNNYHPSKSISFRHSIELSLCPSIVWVARSVLNCYVQEAKKATTTLSERASERARTKPKFHLAG